MMRIFDLSSGEVEVHTPHPPLLQKKKKNLLSRHERNRVVACLLILIQSPPQPQMVIPFRVTITALVRYPSMPSNLSTWIANQPRLGLPTPCPVKESYVYLLLTAFINKRASLSARLPQLGKKSVCPRLFQAAVVSFNGPSASALTS